MRIPTGRSLYCARKSEPDNPHDVFPVSVSPYGDSIPTAPAYGHVHTDARSNIQPYSAALRSRGIEPRGDRDGA